MFGKKLEVRLVKDANPANETASKDDAVYYTVVAEEAIGRLGKKLIIGAVSLIVATAVVSVLANAADSALTNLIND